MYYVYTPDYKSFTLVDVATGKDGPTFLDAAMFRGILNGDTVSIYDSGERSSLRSAQSALPPADDRDPPISLVSRARHPTLSGILVLNTKTIYGLTSRNVPIYLFHPFDRRYPPFRVGCTEKSRTNKVATISFEDWSARDTFPRGALVQLLGNAGDFAAERAGLEVAASPFYSHKAFMGLPLYMEPPAGRELLSAESGWTVFNVDPEGCRDIDDCIAIRGQEFMPSGARPVHNSSEAGVEFAICIADVDAAVPAGGRVDEYAALTAQTIYRDGAAVRPMLPPALSESICSLVAGAVRPVVALRGRIIDGTIRDLRFQVANILNGRSYTYEEADGTLKETLAPLMVALGCESDDSHEWIAAAMTFYNLEAAKVLVARGCGILRGHAGVKVERYEALVAALGPEVAARLASDAAKYSLVGSGATHAGFGGAAYCHATSPIRRYADLVNQRVLKDSGHQLAAALIYNLNVRGKAAKEYERACAFMEALAAPSREVEVVSAGGGRAYVQAWNKLIKYGGPSGRVRYFYDATKPKWSQRLVFEQCDAYHQNFSSC